MDRLGKLEQEVSALREDSKQLRASVTRLRTRLNALASIARVDDGARCHEVSAVDEENDTRRRKLAGS